ncbi:RNA polymerase III RPC4-domain-containing protein [Aspergillus avenaceus]|uniref:RNA polymerase III RPC4-domain-containing protein n=1 Tax=Aspergillus avenaceus TaxID=36643 RepID=A0A5N6TJR6_ASPAV|nr:RNA polymerase III RPC4-domain-containing protein [Aspergillus avenaceus]
MPPKAAPRRGAAAAAANRRPEAPASSNTATPAPAEASAGPSTTRPPVQRLQSLKKRTPSGSIGPAAKPPGPGGPGEPAKPTLKYKPRAVGRRSKEEREAIEKLEAERHRERLAEAAAIQRGRGHGAGRGLGRGRGGQFGSAGGPLGSMAGRRGRGGGPGGFGSRFGGQDSRASSMSRRSRSVIDVGSGAVSRDVSSDESDNEIRVSIDHINLDSDEETEQVVEKKKGKIAMRNADSGEKGLRPIRVERHEHEERVISVNMESSSSKSAELRQQAQAKAGEDEALFVPDDDGTPTTETEPRVKEEPKDDDRVMTDVAPHADEGVTTDDGFLPEQKVKVRRKLGSREPPAVKDPKSLLRTKEDVEEYERHEQDLAMVKDLFAKEEKPAAEEPKEPQPEQTEQSEQPEQSEKSPEKETENAEAADTETAADDKEKEADGDEDDSANHKLSGQLFLMQFPPMTPNLLPRNDDNPDAASTETPGQNASEGTATNGDNQLEPVKQEDGVEVIDEVDGSVPTESSKVVTATDWQLRAGRVGKLNVHASGRVTMDWGGISFELDRATAVDFLQEALIVSGPNPEEQTPEEDNRVWAMGQLSGKFTVTPDWEKML